MHVDISELEAHRPSLTGHCYRMLGSAADAEDAVQETIVRAWKSLDRFEGRSSLRTWLQRIATNICLDALSDESRRFRPIETGEPGWNGDPQLPTRERKHWLEPVAEARVLPRDSSPEELAVLRQSIRLAFVAALQHLPPRQRAALLLTDVLGWSAAEVADALETTVAATNSAIQRARATLGAHNLKGSVQAPLSAEQSALLDRYVQAFHDFDVETLTSLLREDATMSMPPFELWLRGPKSVRDWLFGPGAECEGSKLVRVAASGAPAAFAQYRRDPEGGHKAWALIVLEVDGERIVEWNSFLDVETMFPLFELPLKI